MLKAPIPTDGTRIITVHGLECKIGVHGFVYCWLNDQWTKSTKIPSDLILTPNRRIF